MKVCTAAIVAFCLADGAVSAPIGILSSIRQRVSLTKRQFAPGPAGFAPGGVPGQGSFAPPGFPAQGGFAPAGFPAQGGFAPAGFPAQGGFAPGGFPTPVAIPRPAPVAGVPPGAPAGFVPGRPLTAPFATPVAARPLVAPVATPIAARPFATPIATPGAVPVAAAPNYNSRLGELLRQLADQLYAARASIDRILAGLGAKSPVPGQPTTPGQPQTPKRLLNLLGLADLTDPVLGPLTSALGLSEPVAPRV